MVLVFWCTSTFDEASMHHFRAEDDMKDGNDDGDMMYSTDTSVTNSIEAKH